MEPASRVRSREDSGYSDSRSAAGQTESLPHPTLRLEPRLIPVDDFAEAAFGRWGLPGFTQHDHAFTRRNTDDFSSVSSSDKIGSIFSSCDNDNDDDDVDESEESCTSQEGDFTEELDRKLEIHSLDHQSYGVSAIRLLTSDFASLKERPSATFTVHWEMVEFIEDQLDNCPDDFPSAVTLTGSVNAVVAMTCQQYVSQNWPETGEPLLACITQWLKGHFNGLLPVFDSSRTSKVETSTVRIEAFGRAKSPTFVVSGSRYCIEQAGIVLCWLAATFRLPYAGPPRYSASYLFTRGPRIHISLRQPRKVDIDDASSTCWMSLFHRMNIAQEFPVPDRSSIGVTGSPPSGLELSFTLMVTLAGVQYPLPVGDTLILRGASSILTPIYCDHSAVFWHLEATADKASFLEIEELSKEYLPRKSGCTINPEAFAQLPAARQFLGYCSEANVLLGTEASGYDHIGRASANEEGSDIKFTGFSTGAGTEGMSIFGGSFTANFKLTKGARANIRDMPLSDFERLAKAAHQCSLLYDTEMQRGWLVPELSLLMHCLLTWASDQGILSQMPFASVASDGGDAAFDAIFHSKDTNLDILGESIPFKRRVMLFFNLFQQRKEAVYLRDHSDIFVTRRIRQSRELRGWDYRELVEFKDYPRRKSVKMAERTTWCKPLQRHPDILVLLCKGLNRPIVPRPDAQLCFTAQNRPDHRSSIVATNRCASKIGVDLTFEHKLFKSSPSFYYEFATSSSSSSTTRLERHKDIELYFQSHPDGAIIFCDKDNALAMAVRDHEQGRSSSASEPAPTPRPLHKLGARHLSSGMTRAQSTDQLTPNGTSGA